MRKDMSKVVVERPRRYGHGKGPTRLSKHAILAEAEDKEEDEEFSSAPAARVPPRQKKPLAARAGGVRESMRRQHQGDRKHFNDYLRPLFRFLKSKVGHKWDNVYSEICAVLKGDSTTLDHVRGHVFDYVNISVIFDDKGRPDEVQSKFGWRRKLYDGDLYVDQKGFLRLYQKKVAKKDSVKELPPPQGMLARVAYELNEMLFETNKVERPERRKLHNQPHGLPYAVINGRLMRLGEGARYQRASPEDCQRDFAMAATPRAKQPEDRHTFDSASRFQRFVLENRKNIQWLAEREVFLARYLENEKAAIAAALARAFPKGCAK